MEDLISTAVKYLHRPPKEKSESRWAIRTTELLQNDTNLTSKLLILLKFYHQLDEKRVKGVFMPRSIKHFRRHLLTAAGGAGIGAMGLSQWRSFMKSPKKIARVIHPTAPHWVGDGFQVHTLFHPTPDLYNLTNPFILMDYAPKKIFKPSIKQRGVGEHPHRGFETVTFVYNGEITHKDSSGGGGTITHGDIQWMTAASGVVHEELHSKKFAQSGGIFEMVQLWVNLPKEFKMSDPKYQEIKNSNCPRVRLSSGAEVKVIAGEFQDHYGPSQTYTAMNIYQIRLPKGGSVPLDFESETNTAVLVLEGDLKVQNQSLKNSTIALFEKKGELIDLVAQKEAQVLVLNGEPIDEPMVARGPFVMNTESEIIEAIRDFQSGKMGRLKQTS